VDELIVEALPRLRSIRFWVVATVAALCAGGLAWWGTHHGDRGLIIAMAMLGSAPFVVRIIDGRWDPFEPINLLAIAILVLFVARPIVELNQHMQPYPGYNVRAGFTHAMLIGLVGTAALYGAYFSRAGVRIANGIPSARCASQPSYSCSEPSSRSCSRPRWDFIR
jgi:ABC-type amino acid transport system permease subunit